MPGQRVPAAGGEAAAEVDGHLPVEAALGEELAGRGGVRRAQLLGEEGRGSGVGRDQPRALADVGAIRRSCGTSAVVLVLQFDIRAASEEFDREEEFE